MRATQRQDRYALRLLGVALVFLVTTGQASTDGCAPSPEAAAGTNQAAAPPAGRVLAPPAAAPATGAPSSAFPAPGKYGCVESISRFRNGSYEYDTELRGFIVIEAGGRYTDPFQVVGNFRPGPVEPSAIFSGGALDGATVTPLEEDRLWVVIPTVSGERRWSCGPA